MKTSQILARLPVLKRAPHRYARVVEAFEQFVALALETEGLVVSGALKFPVKVRTTKAAYEEWQTQGFEVDLVGARSDRLVLATVKSFFGSRVSSRSTYGVTAITRCGTRSTR